MMGFNIVVGEQRAVQIVTLLLGTTEGGMGWYLVVGKWVMRYLERYVGISYATGHDIIVKDETKWLVFQKMTKPCSSCIYVYEWASELCYNYEWAFRAHAR